MEFCVCNATKCDHPTPPPPPTAPPPPPPPPLTFALLFLIFFFIIFCCCFFLDCLSLLDDVLCFIAGAIRFLIHFLFLSLSLPRSFGFCFCWLFFFFFCRHGSRTQKERGASHLPPSPSPSKNARRRMNQPNPFLVSHFKNQLQSAVLSYSVSSTALSHCLHFFHPPPHSTPSPIWVVYYLMFIYFRPRFLLFLRHGSDSE